MEINLLRCKVDGPVKVTSRIIAQKMDAAGDEKASVGLDLLSDPNDDRVFRADVHGSVFASW